MFGSWEVKTCPHDCWESDCLDSLSAYSASDVAYPVAGLELTLNLSSS